MKKLAGIVVVAGLFFLVLSCVTALAQRPDNIQYIVRGNPVWNPKDYCDFLNHPTIPTKEWNPPKKGDIVTIEPDWGGVAEVCGFFRVIGNQDAGWIQKKYLQLAQSLISEDIPALGYRVYYNPYLVAQSDTWKSISRTLKIPEYSLKAGDRNKGDLYPGRTIWYVDKKSRPVPR